MSSHTQRAACCTAFILSQGYSQLTSLLSGPPSSFMAQVQQNWEGGTTTCPIKKSSQHTRRQQSSPQPALACPHQLAGGPTLSGNTEHGGHRVPRIRGGFTGAHGACLALEWKLEKFHISQHSWEPETGQHSEESQVQVTLSTGDVTLPPAYQKMPH